MELLGKPVKLAILNKINEKIEKGISFVSYLIYNPNIVEAVIYKQQIEKQLIKLNLKIVDCPVLTSEDLLKYINLGNTDEKGMIFVCRPLKVENEEKYIELINPSKDPDMLTSASLGKLAKGNLNYLSGTSMAVKEIFDYYNIDLVNKKCLVLGRSLSVGLPIYLMCIKKNALVSVVHSKITKENISNQAKQSDIIILATGQRGLVQPSDLNENQIIIDCGYHEDGQGDLGFIPNVKAYTPVPGGVGPITISCLILNAFNKSEK